MTPNWLIVNRAALWRIGAEYREMLMIQYMTLYQLTQRPPLQNVYEELIGDFHSVRIIDGPLPMDRYAQTEVVGRRAEITLNSLIAKMPDIKDVHGVRHLAAWHELIHILADVERRDLPPLTDLRSGLEESTSSPLLCSASTKDERRWSLYEQAIETVALAAAVSDADLCRSPSYRKFAQLAGEGGEMGAAGWQLLAKVANAIGVNRTALRRYLEQHGICRLLIVNGKARLIGTQQPFRGFVCLEPEPATRKSIA